MLSLLRKEYGNSIVYQFYGSPDFLDVKEKMVLDTKYMTIYNDSRYEIENIRQLSGYARDKKVLEKLEVSEDCVVDCVIIYPCKEHWIPLMEDV